LQPGGYATLWKVTEHGIKKLVHSIQSGAYSRWMWQLRTCCKHVLRLELVHLSGAMVLLSREWPHHLNSSNENHFVAAKSARLYWLQPFIS